MDEVSRIHFRTSANPYAGTIAMSCTIGPVIIMSSAAGATLTIGDIAIYMTAIKRTGTIIISHPRSTLVLNILDLE